MMYETHSTEMHQDPAFADPEVERLGSPIWGPIRVSIVRTIPSYREDNRVAFRHWNPPGA